MTPDQIQYQGIIISGIISIVVALITLIGVYIGAKITSKSDKKISEITTKMEKELANRSLKDSLDSKSGWREKLFNVASSEKIGKKEIHTIRATQRYKEHKNTFNLYYHQKKIYRDKPMSTAHCNYKNMTKTIIEFCDDSLNGMETNVDKKARIYARYLLKYHWEILHSGENEDNLSEEMKPKVVEWIQDTLLEICEADNEDRETIKVFFEL